MARPLTLTRFCTAHLGHHQQKKNIIEIYKMDTVVANECIVTADSSSVVHNQVRRAKERRGD